MMLITTREIVPGFLLKCSHEAIEEARKIKEVGDHTDENGRGYKSKRSSAGGQKTLFETF